MKITVLSSRAKLSAVILFFSFSFASAESVADVTLIKFRPVLPSDISDILTMISSNVHSNYEQIKTWEGRIDASVDIVYEGREAKRILHNKKSCIGKNAEVVREHRHTTIEFAADCEQNFFYAKKYGRYPRQYIDVESGKILCTKSNLGYDISIGTPEHEILCLPDSKRGDSIASRKAIKKAVERDCASCGSDVLDPREFFLAVGPLWEIFPRLLQHINKHGEFSVDGHHLKVEERTGGGIAEYRIQIPGRVSPGQYLFITMVFSSEKAFNTILLETIRTDGKLFQKKSWDYELVDGVYLPSTTTEQNFTGENSKLTYDAKIVFKNLEINHPIPSEMFTYTNLGLENGDRFIDKMQNKQYIYQDETLVALDEHNQ